MNNDRGTVRFILTLILVSVVAVILTRFLYRSPQIAPSVIEPMRQEADKQGEELYNTGNIVFKALYASLFGNGDKYVFRPPRIIPTLTFQGGEAYEVFGMVTAWDPATRLIHVSSYLGKPLIVRFDPSADGSVAFVPLLDDYGVVTAIRDTDFVTQTDSDQFAALFCTSDILSIRLAKPGDANASSDIHPVIPKEIRLSQRICEQ